MQRDSQTTQSDPRLQEVATQLQPEVLQAILGARRRSAENFAGRRVFDENVLLMDELAISARSETYFRIRRHPPEHPFCVIAAGMLTIEVPAIRDDAAKIDYWNEGPALAGSVGLPGNNGRSWGIDWTAEDGEHGGRGDTGGPGVPGKSLDKPPLFIVYREIRLVGGNPQTGLPLSINLYGYEGGNGGRGGIGGAGGNGAKGTPSSVGGIPIPPFIECKSGPGIGGNAGMRGQGGRGGDAGRGGNGGNVYYVGPRGPNDTYAGITRSFEVFLNGGGPGLPGLPGDVGAQGQLGESGRRRDPCNSRSPGNPSEYPTPLDGGPGAKANRGSDGERYRVWRDNLDIFP